MLDKIEQTTVNPKVSRIFVPMNCYQYISRELAVLNNITGFATNNLCDCVGGFVTSDQGYAFFHFSRDTRENSLAEYVFLDFANATNIKLTLLGGNPGMFYFPWKSKNRNVMFSDSKPRDRAYGREAEIDLLSPDLKRDDEALQLIKNTIEQNPDHEARCYALHNNFAPDQPQKIDFDACISMNENNVLMYDVEKLNALFTPEGKKMFAAGPKFQFTPHNIKDTIGYQNIAKVMQALTKNPKLFNKENITHRNTVNNAEVLADFNNGQCRIFDAKSYNRRENKSPELDYSKIEIDNCDIKRIPYADKFSPLTSIHRQGFKSGYVEVDTFDGKIDCNNS